MEPTVNAPHDAPLTATVIDASLRFARSNPSLLRYAREHAVVAGKSVDELLLAAIGRVADERASAPTELGSANLGLKRNSTSRRRNTG